MNERNIFKTGDVVYHVSSHIAGTEPIKMTVCNPAYDCYGNVNCVWYTKKLTRIYSSHPPRSLRYYNEENSPKNYPEWKEL